MRTELGKKGRKYVEQNFDRNTINEKLLKVEKRYRINKGLEKIDFTLEEQQFAKDFLPIKSRYISKNFWVSKNNMNNCRN